MSTPGFGTRPGARGHAPGCSGVHGDGRGRIIARLAAILAALPVAAAPAVLLTPPADSADAAARPSAKTAYLMVTAVTTTPVRSDGRAAYIVSVRNIGPGVAKGTEVSSALRKGVTYTEGPERTSAAGRTVTTKVGDVAAGTTVTVTIRVRVDVSVAGASSAGTSSVRSTTAPVRAPSLDAPPLRYHAAQGPTPTPSPSLLPAPASPPAPSPGTVTPRPTVTVTVTPDASSSPSPTVTATRTLYAADPAAPPPSPEIPAVPDPPLRVRPPHDLALPPPNQALGPLSGAAPSVAPTPARTVTIAPLPARPAPRAQAAPSLPPAADPAMPRRSIDLGAEVRDLLPFTGLPLAMLAGAAGVLLIAGILAIRAARRRRAQD